MRTFALLVIALMTVAAVAASDRSKPLIADDQGVRDNAHVWLQICDPIIPFNPPTNLERPKKVHEV